MITKKEKDLEKLALWNNPMRAAFEPRTERHIVAAPSNVETTEEAVNPADHPVIESHSSVCVSTPEQVHDIAQQLQGNATYVMDLETTGLNPRQNKIITIAFGTPDQVYIIDVRRFHSASESLRTLWCEALQRLFHREDIVWAGHNLKFDWSFVAVQFGVRMRRVYDTMIVEKLIHNGARVSASLKNAAARYGIAVSKEEVNYFIGLDQRPKEWSAPIPPAQITYIEQDIIVPHQLIASQQVEIDRQSLGQVIELENAALPAIASIEVNGLLVDVARWRHILEAKLARKEKLEGELKSVLSNALADKAEQDTDGKLFSVRPDIHINLGSRDQLLSALACLGVRVDDTKAESLEEVKGQHDSVGQLLDWKNLEKFITAFGDSVLGKVEEDSRIHATFEQLGAVSGRIICRDPNLQQIPKSNNHDEDIRSCFVAPSGYKFLVADLSNIELRILAEVSGDPTMLRFFDEGKDLHAETARLMFKLGPDVDTKKHLINGVKARDIAKTINFGIAYGMGPGGLAARIGVDPDAAKKLLSTYKETYKGVVTYLDQSSREAINQKYVTSLSGRRRTFLPETLADRQSRGEAERAARNHPIQGANADILKRALALLSEQLPEDVHIVLTVHDEICLEAPDIKVEEATNILKECMMQACRKFLHRVEIPEIDVLVAGYWIKG
ncbi:MAG TPA: DNA polymerase [Ktedonobacteraceae bacterium]|jgi:DNA polymerase I-like protein with 3'-5' exonuclease and polymerase domains|nr:DNA polymerase [Ktedonobacteraceae bacterium]